MDQSSGRLVFCLNSETSHLFSQEPPRFECNVLPSSLNPCQQCVDSSDWVSSDFDLFIYSLLGSRGLTAKSGFGSVAWNSFRVAVPGFRVEIPFNGIRFSSFQGDLFCLLISYMDKLARVPDTSRCLQPPRPSWSWVDALSITGRNLASWLAPKVWFGVRCQTTLPLSRDVLQGATFVGPGCVKQEDVHKAKADAGLKFGLTRSR